MDEHTFLEFYISYFVQVVGGINYMVLFGVVLAMGIGFCKLIDVCFKDFATNLYEYQWH